MDVPVPIVALAYCEVQVALNYQNKVHFAGKQLNDIKINGNIEIDMDTC
jgi:hypothetical protein